MRAHEVTPRAAWRLRHYDWGNSSAFRYTIVRRMELIPKVLIVGAIMAPPPGVPGGPEVTMERLNRAWSEIAPKYGYRGLQVAPDGSGAQFIGSSADDAVILNPPLLQVRDIIGLGASHSASKAQDVIKTVGRHLGASQFVNLGVRHVYHAPAPERDARAFVMTRLLGKDVDDLGELAGGGSAWVGLKVVTDVDNQRAFTLIIEPLVRDDSLLFIDLDAQFPGQVDLDTIERRAQDAESYLSSAVNGWLDRH
jgi:hypothetical protein